jgi:hypothetical protein
MYFFQELLGAEDRKLRIEKIKCFGETSRRHKNVWTRSLKLRNIMIRDELSAVEKEI